MATKEKSGAVVIEGEYTELDAVEELIENTQSQKTSLERSLKRLEITENFEQRRVILLKSNKGPAEQTLAEVQAAIRKAQNGIKIADEFLEYLEEKKRDLSKE